MRRHTHCARRSAPATVGTVPRKARKRAAAPARLEPRKRPTQARARMTVEAILDAAEQLLERAGFEGTTTNAVAERAGVSVGSLYQYFPNKEAIVVAIADRFADRVLTMLERHMEQTARLPLASACRSFVRALVAVHAAQPRLHSALIATVPRIAGVDPLAGYQARIIDRLCAYLATRRDEIDVQDLETAVFVLVHAVQGATHAAVLYDPEALSDGRLADSLDELVLRFLGVPRPPG